MSPRRLIYASALVSLLLAVSSPLAVAEPGDSVIGAGVDYVGRPFSVNASGGAGCAASGTMTVTAPDGSGRITAQVAMIVTDANVAELGGPVVSASDPTLVGAWMYWFVISDITNASEFDALWILFTPAQVEPACTFPEVVFGGFAQLRSGDLTVTHDGRTAEQQLADLIAQLQSASTGPGGSYLAKLDSIAASITAGNATAACGKLDAFASEVRAQAAKKLTQTEADTLLRETVAIKTKVGCP